MTTGDMGTGARTGQAMVFPGMAPSKFADVGRFMAVNPFARGLAAVAGKRLGYPLLERMRQDDSDYSTAAQVGFLVNCLALARWAEQELGVRPDVCAGPSFGEKALAAYCGALEVEDAVWMTARLARLQDTFFATEFQDVVTHSFTRTPREKLDEVLDELTARGEWHEISCHIDRDFFMVSLRERNLDWLLERLRSLGGFSLYTMRPPMHASVFGALRRQAEDEVIGTLPFADPTLPVVADQDGAVLTTGEQVRSMLLDSFVRPMRWTDVVDTLVRRDVGTVCVAGPDSLFGRVACTTANFEVLAATPRLAMQPRRRGAVA
ncbi:ACP S-malonyltransferase [Kitasatospora purpeofusca]|uniref:ACP S-malonyltransferase n=1 Tax=Kitasatospora purpeofusca TaxID=67352 RepID=UPI0036D3C870